MTKKEKIIENIKKNKVGLIICGIIFVGLLLLNLCKCSTDKVNDKVNVSYYNPIVLELDNKVYDIKKANIIVSYANEYLYPQDTFSVSPSYLPTDYPLIYINDSNTYIYCKVVNSDYNFYVTNGVIDNIIARYSYNNYVCTLITNGSDGYLYSINYDGELVYNSFTIGSSNYTIQNLNIFGNTLNYTPLWIGTITIGINDDYNLGYQDGYEFGTDEGYNKGYNEGVTYGTQLGEESVLNNLDIYDLYTEEQYDNNYTNGVNSVVNNPNNYGLYTQTQYDDNYDLGYSTAESEITPDLATNGFKTMFNSVLNAPLNILGGILNFEFFGINVFNLFSFLFTLVLIGFVIKLLI